MELFENGKTFSWLFIALLGSTLNFEYFPKKRAS